MNKVAFHFSIKWSITIKVTNRFRTLDRMMIEGLKGQISQLTIRFVAGGSIQQLITIKVTNRFRTSKQFSKGTSQPIFTLKLQSWKISVKSIWLVHNLIFWWCRWPKMRLFVDQGRYTGYQIIKSVLSFILNFQLKTPIL